jgi:uncharacterized protein YcfJ
MDLPLFHMPLRVWKKIIEPCRSALERLIMKKAFVVTALALAAGVCAAQQDVGRVISTQPVMQQVAVPRQVCTNEQVAVQPAKSGAGAAMGAVAGGLLGNQIGSGGGRALATFAGLVGGILLGDRIEGAPPAQVQHVQNCNTQTFLENRIAAYNVTYEYAGKQYTVQMPNDPGPTIRVQVTPVGAIQSAPPVYSRPYPPAVQAPVAVNTYRATPYDNRPFIQPYDMRRNDNPPGGEANPGL